jgi:hypothetical protein
MKLASVEPRVSPGSRSGPSRPCPMLPMSAPAKLRRNVVQYRIKDMGAVVHPELITQTRPSSLLFLVKIE